jgi:hypothetical protein
MKSTATTLFALEASSLVNRLKEKIISHENLCKNDVL